MTHLFRYSHVPVCVVVYWIIDHKHQCWRGRQRASWDNVTVWHRLIRLLGPLSLCHLSTSTLENLLQQKRDNHNIHNGEKFDIASHVEFLNDMTNMKHSTQHNTTKKLNAIVSHLDIVRKSSFNWYIGHFLFLYVLREFVLSWDYCTSLIIPDCSITYY